MEPQIHRFLAAPITNDEPKSAWILQVGDQSP